MLMGIFEAVAAHPVIAFLVSAWVIILIHAAGTAFGHMVACALAVKTAHDSLKTSDIHFAGLLAHAIEASRSRNSDHPAAATAPRSSAEG